MNAPRLLFVFALAFVLGVAATALHQHRAGMPAAVVTQADSGDRNGVDEESDTQDDAPAWPDNAPTPEQVLYSQPQLLRDAAAKLLQSRAQDGERPPF